jgi:hypothetical protein
MIAALAALSFTPIKFLHPLRVRHWRLLNIALLAAWAALAFLAVINDLAPGPYVTWPLVAIAIYFSAPACCAGRPDRAGYALNLPEVCHATKELGPLTHFVHCAGMAARILGSTLLARRRSAR